MKKKEMKVDIIHNGSIVFSIRRRELRVVTFTSGGFEIYEIPEPCHRVLIAAFSSEYSFIIVTVHP
jgi:hypothetical protein